MKAMLSPALVQGEYPLCGGERTHRAHRGRYRKIHDKGFLHTAEKAFIRIHTINKK